MSGEYIPPCRAPENDPNDWFIERDGKQYADDALVTLEEAEERHAKLLAEDPETTYTVADVFESLEGIRRRAALRKRRHAKDACHVDCQIRAWCLDQGMQPGREKYGTMGGYFPEERQVMQREIRRRARARAERVGD